MKTALAATRYARALFELASDSGRAEKVLNELRTLERSIAQDHVVTEVLLCPLVTADDLSKSVNKALEGAQLSPELTDCLKLLAKRKRLNLLSDLVVAYQVESDNAAGVARGVVRSATTLAPEERKKIEEYVSKATKKKAILEYRESQDLIGGLVANVGSYTFDDSLGTQLELLQGQLKRSGH